MTMTLAEARATVRRMLDDVAQERWDSDAANTEVDSALVTAQSEALQVAAACGTNLLSVTGAFTSTSSGVVDLSSVKPARVKSVNSVVAGIAIPVDPWRAGDGLRAHPQAEAISVVYVPGPVFPASSGANFVWGSSAVDAPELDKFMCAIAASEMKIKEGEVNAGLEKRKAELRAAVETRVSVPSWTSRPMNRRRLWWGWTMSGPHTMQLVDK